MSEIIVGLVCFIWAWIVSRGQMADILTSKIPSMMTEGKNSEPYAVKFTIYETLKGLWCERRLF